MYDLIDRPVAELPVFERYLLDATRTWVHALTLAGVPATATASGFAGHGGATACAAFDQVMRAMDEGSAETLVFQRPCHSDVEETEAVVLGIWRLVRADRIAAAQVAAAALFDGTAARAVIAGMTRVVAADYAAG